jgi:acetoin utilization deacetylase AcuC-like enzyme
MDPGQAKAFVDQSEAKEKKSAAKKRKGSILAMGGSAEGMNMDTMDDTPDVVAGSAAKRKRAGSNQNSPIKPPPVSVQPLRVKKAKSAKPKSLLIINPERFFDKNGSIGSMQDSTPGTPWDGQVAKLAMMPYESEGIGASDATQVGAGPKTSSPLYEAVCCGDLEAVKAYLTTYQGGTGSSNGTQVAAVAAAALSGSVEAVVGAATVASAQTGAAAGIKEEPSVEQPAPPVQGLDGQAQHAAGAALPDGAVDMKVESANPPAASTSVLSASTALALATLVNEPAAANGRTPFHAAVRLGRKAGSGVALQICKLLVGAGASCAASDDEGNTVVHVAAARGHTSILQLLKNDKQFDADCCNREGETILHCAARAGHVGCVRVIVEHFKTHTYIRNHDLKTALELAGTSSSASKGARDSVRAQIFASDPTQRTLVLEHEDCLEHKPRKVDDWESPARIKAILGQLQKPGMLTKNNALNIANDFPRASVSTLQRAHSRDYIRFVHDLSKQVAQSEKVNEVVPFTPHVQSKLKSISKEDIKSEDACDTSFSPGSLNAARRAVGAVCYAVERVVSEHNRNAFCVVRPPGHHAGLSGLLEGASSCGFCIFNNVAAGALHAAEVLGVKKIAIVDLDVHHGNGTEEILKAYHDPNQFFFFSIHLFDKVLMCTKKSRRCVAPDRPPHHFLFLGAGQVVRLRVLSRQWR